jgi:hypothetical protein
MPTLVPRVFGSTVVVGVLPPAMDDDGLTEDTQIGLTTGLADDVSGTTSAQARLSRKRTKTGCLSEFARSPEERSITDRAT